MLVCLSHYLGIIAGQLVQTIGFSPILSHTNFYFKVFFNKPWTIWLIAVCLLPSLQENLLQNIWLPWKTQVPITIIPIVKLMMEIQQCTIAQGCQQTHYPYVHLSTCLKCIVNHLKNIIEESPTGLIRTMPGQVSIVQLLLSFTSIFYSVIMPKNV